MNLTEIAQIAGGLGTPFATAAFVWVAVEIKYIRKDVESAHKRVTNALERVDKLRDLVR